MKDAQARHEAACLHTSLEFTDRRAREQDNEIRELKKRQELLIRHLGLQFLTIQEDGKVPQLVLSVKV